MNKAEKFAMSLVHHMEIGSMSELKKSREERERWKKEGLTICYLCGTPIIDEPYLIVRSHGDNYYPAHEECQEKLLIKKKKRKEDLKILEKLIIEEYNIKRGLNKMIKLNIHSIVDVITNSSTVIYTYQNSTKEAKELLQEILNLIGNNETVEDSFYVDTFLDDDQYVDYSDASGNDFPEDFPEDYKDQYSYVRKTKEKIMKGEIERPIWMKKIEEREIYDGWMPDVNLYIMPKSYKYTGLAEKMLKFLNSPECDGGRDG